MFVCDYRAVKTESQASIPAYRDHYTTIDFGMELHTPFTQCIED